MTGSSGVGCQPRSLPSRERGLKLQVGVGGVVLLLVAPFTGAWIEIGICSPRQAWTLVTPFTGAWIEIPRS